MKVPRRHFAVNSKSQVVITEARRQLMRANAGKARIEGQNGRLNQIDDRMEVNHGGDNLMAWDGDALAEQMEENFERQQAVADARANRNYSTAEERARSAEFQSLRVSRSRIMTQLNNATNPSHRAVLDRALKAINDQMTANE
jgi:hypothetical protein